MKGIGTRTAAHDCTWTGPAWQREPTVHLTEYLGGQALSDFDLQIPANWQETLQEMRRYVAGFGVHPGAWVPRDLHGDMIRSTMLTTDETGSVTRSFAYTAFGEPLTGAGIGYPPEVGAGEAAVTRYQYAGGWGYELGRLGLARVNAALPPVTLQHVGARWYDAGIGRFVQRDPVGLMGGLNQYIYCISGPTSAVDPRD